MDEATTPAAPAVDEPTGLAEAATCPHGVELAAETRLGEGRYVLAGVLGRGGFAITYDAVDLRLQRRVAIKELFPAGARRHGTEVLAPVDDHGAFAAARERFGREARVLARFTHPGVVRIYEVFEANGTAYLVMERLRGRTLVDVLAQRGRPFTEAEVLDVAGRVAAALRPVHAAGVLHRDLNPSNVMLTEHGRVVVIDFGLARDFQPDRTTGMTRLVTPGYAPLEQYRGEARFGPATDVYGLAATCYRLATGQVPPSAVERAAGAELVPVHRANPSIAKAVGDAIADGLELDPGHRPADLDAFLARLGVVRLPEGPRSVLLGTIGAEPEALRGSEPPTGDLVDAAVLADASAGAPAVDAPPAVAPPAAPEATVATVVVAAAPADATAPFGGEATVAGAAARPATPASGPTRPGPVDRPGARPTTAGRPAGRAKLTVPLAAAALGASLAVPVLVVAVLVLVAFPVLATVGDAVARRLRALHGVEPTWAQRRLPGPVLTVGRLVRNLGATVLRCSPIIGVAAVLLAGWYALAGTSAPDGLVQGLLRVLGLGTTAAVLAACAGGSSRYRTGLGIDALAERAVPGGRTTLGVVVGWILAVAVVAGALWLQPDPLPLP